MIKTFSGDNEIYETGLVIAFKNEPLLFNITRDLKITISFKNDDSDKKQRMEPQYINSKELELVLVNFNNSLGTGTTEPLPLGNINNRPLFLNFVVYTLGENSQKTFQYSWYLGKEVPHV